MERLGTSLASLEVCHKLLLFLEGSHVRSHAESGTDDFCRKWEAESKPFLYAVIVTVGPPSVGRAVRAICSGPPMSRGSLCKTEARQGVGVPPMVNTAEQTHWVFSLRRIKIEEEYAKNLAKLSQNSLAAQEEG